LKPVLPPFWHPAFAHAFILDWDGVLAETSLDFSEIRNRYFNGKRVPLLEAGRLLPESARVRLEKDIYDLEMRGAEKAEPVPGAMELLDWLDERKIPWAVVSRNCRESIELAANKCGIRLPKVVLSRDEEPVKPHPEALWKAARMLGADRSRCVMVGDFIYDFVGARRAGMRALLVQREEPAWLEWIDRACPTVRALVEELRVPSPWVPWEYRSLADRKGISWLEKAWELTFQVPPDSPDPAGFVHRAASLGIGHFLVEPGLALSVSRWEGSLPLKREWLGEPLSAALSAFLSDRFPLAVVSEGLGGLDLRHEDLESSLAEVLQ
jgi:HAD superfamily hydrolase (TIGR01509 family)